MNQIKVNLSNGKQSPLFAASSAPDSQLKTLNITDPSSIRKIQGTITGNYIYELNFKKADGQEVGKIQSHQYNLDPEEVLGADEEIIGIYGKYNGSHIGSLSLIVWKPPKV